MARRDSELQMDVPHECFEAKTGFQTQPPKELVREIKKFVELTGQPFMWSGHTHSRPPEGSLPVYLDEFELPDRFRKAGRLSPCPCCWPRHAKFAKGRIAWFPDEGVIRLMGADCFRALNQEAHESAELEMRRRKQRDADVAYLLKDHSRLKKAYEVCKAALPVAEAVQVLSKSLRRTFEEKLNLPIWSYVQHGTLPVWEEFSEVRSDGSIKTLSGSKTYAKAQGFRLLQPNLKQFAFRVEQVMFGFRTAFETDDWESFVASLSDEERHKLAKLVNRSVATGRELLAELRELQRFVSPLNVATLRTWGRHEGNKMPFVFERDGAALRIGKNDFARMTVPIPASFENQLEEIDVPLIKEMEQR